MKKSAESETHKQQDSHLVLHFTANNLKEGESYISTPDYAHFHFANKQTIFSVFGFANLELIGWLINPTVAFVVKSIEKYIVLHIPGHCPDLTLTVQLKSKPCFIARMMLSPCLLPEVQP